MSVVTHWPEATNIQVPCRGSSEIRFWTEVKASIKLQTGIESFYVEAAKASRALLADVPGTMERMARLRKASVKEIWTLGKTIAKYFHNIS